MLERSIREDQIKAALAEPTKVGYDGRGHIVIKKLYKRFGRQRLLLLTGEEIKDSFKIITIIETSKVHRYL